MSSVHQTGENANTRILSKETRTRIIADNNGGAGKNTRILQQESSQKRTIEFLTRTFESNGLLDHLNDGKTVEILVNPDCTVWVEKIGVGLHKVGVLDPRVTEQIIVQTAKFRDSAISIEGENLIIECEFPIDGSRFAGQLPPIVQSPSIAIRKKASVVFPLDKYVKDGIMSVAQREIILGALEDHKNIIVAGGTGSGKTTLTNALIQAAVGMFPHERFIIIEDTGEIQCEAENYVQFRTSAHITMTHLLRTSLRVRPDRILVGEVRGPEALDLLDAWNTGHPGGICTLHSTTAESALSRIRMMLSRNQSCPKDVQVLIGEAVDLVIYIQRTPEGSRVVSDLILIDSWDEEAKRYDVRHIRDIRTEQEKLMEELES